MNRVVNILMKRDGMTENEAKNFFNHVRNEVLELIGEGDYQTAEDVIYYNLGLEMDYILDIVN